MTVENGVATASPSAAGSVHPRFSAAEAIAAAFAFWRGRAAAYPGALALLALAVFAYSAAGAFPSGWWGPALFAAYVAATVVTLGAYLRDALAGGRVGADVPGPAGLQWRRMEGRLLGGAALLAGFFLLVGLLVLLIALIVGVAGYSASGEAKPDMAAIAHNPLSWLVSAIVLAAALLGAWASVRLALWAPATAARGRFQVFSTWGLTRGTFWPLLLALVVVSLPLLAVQFALGLALGLLGPEIGDAAWPALLGDAVVAVATALETPLLVGLLAKAYRDLAPTQT